MMTMPPNRHTATRPTTTRSCQDVWLTFSAQQRLYFLPLPHGQGSFLPIAANALAPTRLPKSGADDGTGIAYLAEAHKSVCWGFAAYHAAAPKRPFALVTVSSIGLTHR